MSGKWAKANPERAAAYNVAYNALRSPAKKRAACDAWRMRYPHRAKLHAEEYLAKNRKEVNERQRLRYIANRERLLAVKREQTTGLSAEQWENLCKSFNHRCVYCLEKKPLSVDHVVSVANGGSNDISNLVPACKSCNSSKGDKSLIQWAAARMSPRPKFRRIRPKQKRFRGHHLFVPSNEPGCCAKCPLSRSKHQTEEQILAKKVLDAAWRKRRLVRKVE